MNENWNTALLTEITIDEEENLSGGLGFRRYLDRVQNVPVANTGVSQRPSMPSDGSLGSGNGLHFDLQSYIFGMGAAYLFGNPGVTPAEVQYVWQMALRLR